MWWPEFKTVHAGLSAERVTIARFNWLRPAMLLACDQLPVNSESVQQPSNSQPWRAAVDVLTQWLAEHGGSLSSLQVVLSDRFVRWQLLPWRPELTGANERAAYASLRFEETFGKVAQGWQVLQSLQPPGRAVVACAVDTALIEALAVACSAKGVRLTSVKPYFSSAVDRWRSTIPSRTAWFGVVEPDSLTLGLLQQGHWLALRSQRLSSDWRDTLPGMMAQMGMTGALSVVDSGKPVPLYLAGTGDAPGSVPGLPFTWLQPKGGTQPGPVETRLALGV